MLMLLQKGKCKNNCRRKMCVTTFLVCSFFAFQRCAVFVTNILNRLFIVALIIIIIFTSTRQSSEVSWCHFLFLSFIFRIYGIYGTLHRTGVSGLLNLYNGFCYISCSGLQEAGWQSVLIREGTPLWRALPVQNWLNKVKMIVIKPSEVFSSSKVLKLPLKWKQSSRGPKRVNEPSLMAVCHVHVQ